jgi:hypothetical protein
MMVLRNVGFGSADIGCYAAARLKRVLSALPLMSTGQTLINSRLLAIVGITPEKRPCGREQFSVEAAGCCRGDPIWKRGLGLSLVQDHAGLAQPTRLI